MNENEIDLQIDRDTLSIRAKEQKGEGQEEYRSFFRAVTLPPGIESSQKRPAQRTATACWNCTSRG